MTAPLRPAPLDRRRAAAFGVHVFTGTGAVLGVLAIIAALEGQTALMFLWLAIALVIDGADGWFARRFDVKTRTPNIDGEALDLIVDYITYVVAPAVFVLKSGIVPDWAAWPAFAAILLTSLYTFVRRDMKTEEHDFRGFPAIWNLAVAAFVCAGGPDWANLAAIAVFCVLTFTNLRVVHPMRVESLRPSTLAAAGLWIASAALLIAPVESAAFLAYPLWWAATVYFSALCIIRSASLS